MMKAIKEIQMSRPRFVNKLTFYACVWKTKALGTINTRFRFNSNIVYLAIVTTTTNFYSFFLYTSYVKMRKY